MSDEDVLAANRAFYEAFRAEQLGAMDAVWARVAPVACIHPGWPPLIGRDEVMRSWRGIMASGAPAIRHEAARVVRLGEVALVICHELVAGGRLVATNVFVREDDAWRMVHHQAGPMHLEADADEAPSSLN